MAKDTIPARVAEIAEELRQLPGVVCVVWGARRKGTRWYRSQPCISVHVRKKLAPERLGKRALPKQIDGYRLDVVEVGRPRLHTLGIPSRIDAGSLGISTATLFATRGSDAVALVSGHGTLKGSGGQVRVKSGGRVFGAEIGPGDFGKGLSIDFAIATFLGAAADVDTSHPALDGTSPFRLTKGMMAGDRVKQFSIERGSKMTGIFQGTLLGGIELEGVSYTALLSIASQKSGTPFSVRGDSGSLVVDEDGNPAGAVVGGTPDQDIFYAYDLRRLSSAISAARFALFFEEDE